LREYYLFREQRAKGLACSNRIVVEQCGNGYLLLMDLVWQQNGDAVLGIVRMLAPILDTVSASAGSPPSI
jgi:hypothetical protein